MGDLTTDDLRKPSKKSKDPIPVIPSGSSSEIRLLQSMIGTVFATLSWTIPLCVESQDNASLLDESMISHELTT